MNNEESLLVQVKCTIVKRTLEILDLQETEIDKLSFGNVSYGSTVSKNLIIYNNSPIVTDFVIFIDKKLSECVNMSKGLAMTVTKFESKKSIREPEPSMDAVFNVSPHKV